MSEETRKQTCTKCGGEWTLGPKANGVWCCGAAQMSEGPIELARRWADETPDSETHETVALARAVLQLAEERDAAVQDYERVQKLCDIESERVVKYRADRDALRGEVETVRSERAKTLAWGMEQAAERDSLRSQLAACRDALLAACEAVDDLDRRGECRTELAAWRQIADGGE